MGGAWIAVALFLVFRPIYRALELVFLFFLAVLSVSFLGCALWVGFDPGELVRGLVRVEMPGRQGVFDPWLVALAMIGAVGGSLMNLVYPYFLEAKGWRGPQYRRVQIYDFLLGVVVMLVLNLAVWVLGAELLYPDRHDRTPRRPAEPAEHGAGGVGPAALLRGIFAAIYTSIIGHAAGLGSFGTHAWLRWRAGTGPSRISASIPATGGSRSGACLAAGLDAAGHARLRGADAGGQQRAGRPAAVLAGGLWWITASDALIGREHRNRPWENAVMAALFVLAVYFAYQAVRISPEARKALPAVERLGGRAV